ncbi:hypothetical protein [Flavobacterium sp.]|uniref:hypothetical protein n=1 Tax=Flavobacterium sp. TaxID=239 RepID=UPI002B4AE404|nr:hypothetical protein [Flavobacterium sp.]HLF52774.1 hypothetical protein [Flavobacterium sp.]
MKKKKIRPRNYSWYLLKIRTNEHENEYSPSGHAIAQYVDGIWFEEQSENSLEETRITIIKKLQE